jgi:hypothetical protein
MLDLVIPDSGPLITLGLINRLDLLNRFNCAVLIADMVEYEIKRGPDTAPDKAAFIKWFDKSIRFRRPGGIGPRPFRAPRAGAGR